jgi:hypothetical protein
MVPQPAADAVSDDGSNDDCDRTFAVRAWEVAVLACLLALAVWGFAKLR